MAAFSASAACRRVVSSASTASTCDASAAVLRLLLVEGPAEVGGRRKRRLPVDVECRELPGQRVHAALAGFRFGTKPIRFLD